MLVPVWVRQDEWLMHPFSLVNRDIGGGSSQSGVQLPEQALL